MILLFFANKNGLKGIFFTQNRPGKNEKIFKALKFKTMTGECDAEGNLLPDADRLTKVGKFNGYQLCNCGCRYNGGFQWT